MVMKVSPYFIESLITVLNWRPDADTGEMFFFTEVCKMLNFKLWRKCYPFQSSLFFKKHRLSEIGPRKSSNSNERKT